VPLSEPLVLDSADERSLDAVDQVLMRAYKMTSRRSRVKRYVALEPGGWVTIRDGSDVVGVGGCIAYRTGGFGWIGLIGTDPSAERKGIARTITAWLVDYLATRGCASVLDASAAGAPLYERMGFADAGLSHVLLAPEVVMASTVLKTDVIVDAMVSTDLSAVSSYDTPRFGADRFALLEYLLSEEPGRSVVARRDGRVVGYAMAQSDSIGPVVADDPDVVRALLGSLLATRWAAPPRLVVPPESMFHAVVSDLGFSVVRSLRRQQLGINALPGSRELICAQTSLGEG
jgi:GNAT superfamily N-acetyltransferase